MFYTNGGETWNDKTNWLNDESHCAWSGVTCDASSHVTEVNLAGNSLTGPMTDLSGLSSINKIYLDFNTMEGPISSSICNKVAEGTLFLQGDDYICNDDSTPPGCCSMTRASKSITDAAISNFGTANCKSLSDAPDINTCEWMENQLNHPLYDDPSNLLNDITVSSVDFHCTCFFAYYRF